MTVSSTTRKAGPFAGNGAATTFPFTFKVFDKTNVKVLLVNASGVASVLTLDSDYSVSLNPNQNSGPGGWVSYPVVGNPLPLGYSLVMLGDLAYDQLTDITNGGGFYPDVIEAMSDRSTIQIQQLAELGSRAIVITEAESVSPVLPNAAARASQMLGFDALGNITLLPIPASVGAGDMRDEIGSDGKPGFVAGTDFIAGTTTQLVLSRAPGIKANVWVEFDGVYQGGDQIQSLIGNTLTFTAPIPLGTNRVYVRTGTSLSVSVTPDGSVTDAKVSVASKLYNRINDWVDVRDFGAKGDGITDDTVAIQAAINFVNPFTWRGTTRATELNSTGGTVYFPRGTYLVTSKLRLAPQVRLLGDGAPSDWSSRSGANGTATGGAYALGSCIKSTVSNFSTYAFDTSPWSSAGARVDDYLQTGGDSTSGAHTQVSGVCIENMVLLGNWTCKGLNLAGADLCRLKNVYIKGFTIGVRGSGIWYGKFDDVRVVANYRGILMWQSVTDLVMVNTHVLYSVDGIAYNPAVSGRDSGDPVPVLDLTQPMIDLATGIVNWYSNVEGLNVDVENFPQAFLTLNGVDSYRGVYVEGISGIVLRIQGSDQQNSYFEFDTVNLCTGDLIWSSNSRLTVEVRNNNYTQANFGKLYNFLNWNNNRSFVPALRGVFENGTDTVSAQLVRNLADDYGEGGWTPILGFGGVAAGAQARSVGKWIRIGRICIAKFSIQIPTLSGATGNAAIAGLPFQSESVDGTDMMVGVMSFIFNAPTNMQPTVLPGSTGINMFQQFTATPTTQAGFSNGVDIRGQVTYMIQAGQ